jgi:hypothetical protein
MVTMLVAALVGLMASIPFWLSRQRTALARGRERT